MNIKGIEIYFNTFGYPDEDIEIKPGVYILCESAQFFVESTLECLKAHPLNNCYMPYYLLLLRYYKIVSVL